MPSWSQNLVRFESTSEPISRITDALDESTGNFDFHLLRPIPEKILDNQENLIPTETQEEADKINRAHQERYGNMEVPQIRARTAVEIDALEAEFGVTSEHDWIVKNWTVKWSGTDAKIVEQSESHVVVSFVTPWELPVALLDYLTSEEGGSFRIVGGAVKESTNDFQFYGDPEDFDQHFDAVEEGQGHLGIDHVERSLRLLGA